MSTTFFFLNSVIHPMIRLPNIIPEAIPNESIIPSIIVTFYKKR